MSHAQSSDPGLEQQKQAFRQYLREADKLILDHQFQEARLTLSKARELFPDNVYLTAFEERILVYEAQATSSTPLSAAPKETHHSQTPIIQMESPANSDVDNREDMIRQEIEEKYRKRYTEELQKAELLAREHLDREQGKLAGERVDLERLVTERVSASRQEMELEYQQKVKAAVADTEKQLEQKFAERLHAIEEEITGRATAGYVAETKKLEEQFRSDQRDLLDQERRESGKREHQLKEDHANTLRQALAEQERLQTTTTKQQEEHAHLKARLEKEFETALNHERSMMEQHYNQLSAKLTDQFQAEHGNLKKEFESHLREEVEAMRQKEATDLEEQRASARRAQALQHEKEQEYERMIMEAVAAKEQQLQEEFEKRIRSVEEQITARSTARYDEEKRKLEESRQAELRTILDKERRASEGREAHLKEEHAKSVQQIVESQELLKSKNQQQQLEQAAQLKQQLESEYQSALGRERSTLEEHYRKESVESAEQIKRQNEQLRTEFEVQLRKEVEGMRRKEAVDLEERRATVQRELEAEIRQKYELQLEAERNRIEIDSQQQLEEEKKRLQDEFSEMVEMQNENVQQIRIELHQQMEQEFIERLDRLAQESEHKLELLGARVPESHAERLAFYRTSITPFYRSGLPDADQVMKIMQLKELLGLTFDEHLQIESEVRLDLYVQEVQTRVQSGSLIANQTQKLDDLKQQFGITTEESIQLEPRVIALLQRLTSKQRILVADDEAILLQSIADLLRGHNFHVITAAKVSDALEELMKSPVDLILSDIKFGTDELDGFKFFDAVQRVPSLCTIPFIFMSSLREGVIIRSGMLMGIDDYLTKPVDPDLLLAVIEGKLRRVRTMSEKKNT